MDKQCVERKKMVK